MRSIKRTNVFVKRLYLTARIIFVLYRILMNYTFSYLTITADIRINQSRFQMNVDTI